MDYLNDYVKHLTSAINRLMTDEKQNLEKAAKNIAKATMQGHLIHVFGTDAHAASLSDELFWREGGLVNINPIYDPGFSLAHGAYRAWLIEQLKDYSPAVLDYYRISFSEVIIILSTSCQNRTFMDALLKAKKDGLTIILLVSSVNPRDKQILTKIKNERTADVMIDCSEAATGCRILIPGTTEFSLHCSSIFMSLALNMIHTHALYELIHEGHIPDMLKPLYDPENKQYNEMIIKKYFNRIKNI